MTEFPCWAIMEDGPLAGLVTEVDVSAKELQIQLDGIHQYRRKCWGQGDDAHRIAIFRHTKTLVI